MQYHSPSKCPVCQNNMAVTRLRCGQCGAELSGSFSPCRFCSLEDKHLQFIETFLQCRGSIKEVERALGISYPTVRNMMDAAFTALGYDDKHQTAPDRAAEEQRAEILSRLESGQINTDEAIRALSEIKGE